MMHSTLLIGAIFGAMLGCVITGNASVPEVPNELPGKLRKLSDAEFAKEVDAAIPPRKPVYHDVYGSFVDELARRNSKDLLAAAEKLFREFLKTGSSEWFWSYGYLPVSEDMTPLPKFAKGYSARP